MSSSPIDFAPQRSAHDSKYQPMKFNNLQSRTLNPGSYEAVPHPMEPTEAEEEALDTYEA